MQIVLEFYFYLIFCAAYRTDEGKPWVLPVVRTVEAQMATDPTQNHEYLPVAGMVDFRASALKLLLGEDSPAIVENRVNLCLFQCMSDQSMKTKLVLGPKSIMPFIYIPPVPVYGVIAQNGLSSCGSD